MTLSEVGTIVGLAATTVGLAGTLVGITRYITNLQFQIKLERLEAERNQADKARADAIAANTLLVEELAAARKSGAAASAKKGEIDNALSSIMTLTKAQSGSVYLPLKEESSGNAKGLVFLSIQPTAEYTVKLRKKIIPLNSLAGRCFVKDAPFTVRDAHSATEHYEKADDLSGYRTQDTLNYPLRHGRQCVGVLQLLNKQDGQKFSDQDLVRVEQIAVELARKVNEFGSLPASMDLLGFVAEREGQNATIMFCDLTNSSALFRELNVSAAVQHINEYLEEVCGVAFRHGATVDKYAGDGVLLRFNVPHPLPGHETAAVRCALEIQDRFEVMKKDWLLVGEPLGAIYNRAGLAFGMVQQATVGHPQYQYLTVFGRPVNAAVNLCEGAIRDRNVILIDENLYRKVSNVARVDKVDPLALGKAGNYTSGAYELLKADSHSR